MTSATTTKTLVIIPARLGSTRIEHKLLRSIDGQSVIQRVVARVILCEHIDKIVIATDHQQIAKEVEAYDCDIVITSEAYNCGTDRCDGVMDQYLDYNIVINVQGDQPFIDPAIIDHLSVSMKDDPTMLISSLMTNELCTAVQENVVKVIIDKDGYAQQFSRSLPDVDAYQHIGVYGYTTKILSEIAALPTSVNEKDQRLEQLRWLDAGYKIKMLAVDHQPISIDVESDLTTAAKYNNQ